MADSVSLPYSGGFARSWGHYAPQLLSVAILLVIALGFRPYAVGLTTLLASVGLLLFVLLTWLHMRDHDRRLCERCASSMPLNAAEHAARYQRRFWLVHSGSNPRLLVPYLLVLVGSNFLTSMPGRTVWALVQLSMVYLILAHASHRKLQPWCSWCSGGGGGTEQLDPEPDLPRGDRRQLV
jgi:hypothetical protein